MPFDPTEYTEVADLLITYAYDPETTASPEAFFRTAFTRAYYALYLAVRASIIRRYAVPSRRIHHGALYLHLQSPRAGPRVQSLGRDLERLYRLRQKADYEMDPEPKWRAMMHDPFAARHAVATAVTGCDSVDQLDFSPVIDLF